MNFDYTCDLVEQLRREAIGSPKWLPDKEVYEYEKQSIEVVILLKLVRAAHGLSAIEVLLKHGLWIDFGATIRAINDSIEEVYFLLELYPNASSKGQQFIKAFFENTIDGYLEAETHQVPRDKIRSAVVRTLKGGQDDATRKLTERIYKAFCGYVHGDYVHIMEVYGVRRDIYYLRGVPNSDHPTWRSEYLGLMNNAVLMAATLTAQKMGRERLYRQMLEAVRGTE